MLPVREAELAVEWLFRDGAQEVSLAAPSDGLLATASRLTRQRDATSHGDAPAAITVTKP